MFLSLCSVPYTLLSSKIKHSVWQRWWWCCAWRSYIFRTCISQRLTKNLCNLNWHKFKVLHFVVDTMPSKIVYFLPQHATTDFLDYFNSQSKRRKKAANREKRKFFSKQTIFTSRYSLHRKRITNRKWRKRKRRARESFFTHALFFPLCVCLHVSKRSSSLA